MPDPTPQPEASSKLKLLRVIGPAGAGKTHLITLLIDEFRPLGHFVATAAPRGDNELVTVITTSSGARVTVERAFNPQELCRLVASLDPRATLLLAESMDATGTPAIEVVPPDAHSINSPDLLASVPSTEIAPGALAPLAALIARRLLGAKPEQPRSLFSRLLRGRKGSSD